MLMKVLSNVQEAMNQILNWKTIVANMLIRDTEYLQREDRSSLAVRERGLEVTSSGVADPNFKGLMGIPINVGTDFPINDERRSSKVCRG